MLEQNSPWHGTSNGYARYGCRCESCKKARAEYVKSWKSHPEGQLAQKDSRHGTPAGFHAGCICNACIEAAKAYRKKSMSSYAKNAKKKYAARESKQVIADRARLRPDSVKACNRCYEALPFDRFLLKVSEPDGLRAYCNGCESSRKRSKRYGSIESYWKQQGIAFDTCSLCSGPFEQVDHIYPRALGGPDALWNLQPLCSDHNHSKWSSDPEKFYSVLLTGGDSKAVIQKVELALTHYLNRVKPLLNLVKAGTR